jgi:hypothetical protein
MHTYSAVLDRLTFKTSKAGILVIEGFRQRLDDFLIDMIQALNEGESISPLSCVELCTAVASWFRQAFSWATNLALAPEEADLLRVRSSTQILVASTDPDQTPRSPSQMYCSSTSSCYTRGWDCSCWKGDTQHCIRKLSSQSHARIKHLLSAL